MKLIGSNFVIEKRTWLRKSQKERKLAIEGDMQH